MAKPKWAGLLLWVMLCVQNGMTFAADPLRGRQLYNTAPQPGLLACVDCHGERPQEQNFGNIWAGRHATFLIARAISINTGGMGYFRNFYDQQALADIAAWLGTTPASLNFAESATGSSSAAQGVTLRASTKAAITGLSWQAEGDYTLSPGNCGTTVERFSACTLEVAFAPKEPGQRPGALIISHDGSPTPIRIALSGTGQARPQAVASLSPALLEFSTASPMRTATLRNDSTNPLTVQQVRVSAVGLRWAGGSCTAGVVLTEKATCSVLLAFEPSQTGTSAGQLMISHDGQAGASTIDLRGTAATRSPRLRASIATLDLGVMQPGETATSGWISFFNDGPGPLSWSPPSIDEPAFSVAEADCAPGVQVAEGSSCRVRLALQPTRPGEYTSTLRWPAAAVLTPEVPLSGSASGGAGVLRASLSSMVFAGAAGTSSAAAEQTLVMVNQGALPVELGPLAITGPSAGAFSLLGTGDCSAGVALAPGASCQLSVRFAPKAMGSHRGQLEVGVGAGQAPVRVALSGEGRSVDAVRWAVDHTSLSLADRPTGSAAQALTLRNLDTRPLIIERIAVVGAAAGEMALGGDCRPGSAVQGGQSCQVEIRRAGGGTPTSALASLLIQAGESGHQALIALDGGPQASGPATAPSWVMTGGSTAGAALAALPADIASGSTMLWHGLAVGEAAVPRTVTVLNRGTLPSPPLRWGFAGPGALDWSVARASANGDCQHGQVLPPGAQCTLRVRFHPAGPGLRQGWLFLPRGDGQPALALRGSGWVAPQGRLLMEPNALAFPSTPGVATPSQRVVLLNEGAAMARVASAGIAGAGFQLVPAGANACPPPPFELLPGLPCFLGVAWSGTAEGATGADLVVSLDDGAGELRTALAVAEDPSARTNVGGAGGAMPWPALIGLGWAAWMLRRRDRGRGHGSPQSHSTAKRQAEIAE